MKLGSGSNPNLIIYYIYYSKKFKQISYMSYKNKNKNKNNKNKYKNKNKKLISVIIFKASNPAIFPTVEYYEEYIRKYPCRYVSELDYCCGPRDIVVSEFHSSKNINEWFCSVEECGLWIIDPETGLFYKNYNVYFEKNKDSGILLKSEADWLECWELMSLHMKYGPYFKQCYKLFLKEKFDSRTKFCMDTLDNFNYMNHLQKEKNRIEWKKISNSIWNKIIETRLEQKSDQYINLLKIERYHKQKENKLELKLNYEYDVDLSYRYYWWLFNNRWLRHGDVRALNQWHDWLLTYEKFAMYNKLSHQIRYAEHTYSINEYYLDLISILKNNFNSFLSYCISNQEFIFNILISVDPSHYSRAIAIGFLYKGLFLICTSLCILELDIWFSKSFLFKNKYIQYIFNFNSYFFANNVFLYIFLIHSSFMLLRICSIFVGFGYSTTNITIIYVVGILIFVGLIFVIMRNPMIIKKLLNLVLCIFELIINIGKVAFIISIISLHFYVTWKFLCFLFFLL